MGMMAQIFDSVGIDKLAATLSEVAPYFSTISARFTELRHNHVELVMTNEPRVQNHLGTIHAIAMCNAAELAAGVVTDFSVPEGIIWIPKGMTVEYIAKAKTDLRVESDTAGVDWSMPGDHPVTVSMFDTSGKLVCRARITMNVKRLA